MESIDYVLLRRLGLSKTSIACYRYLSETSSHQRVAVIAKHVGANRSNLYRTLQELEQHGFVQSFEAETLYYMAKPLREALAALHMRERQMFNLLIRRQDRLR